MNENCIYLLRRLVSSCNENAYKMNINELIEFLRVKLKYKPISKISCEEKLREFAKLCKCDNENDIESLLNCIRDRIKSKQPPRIIPNPIDFPVSNVGFKPITMKPEKMETFPLQYREITMKPVITNREEKEYKEEKGIRKRKNTKRKKGIRKRKKII